MALARRAALLVMSLPLATTFVAPRPPRRAAVAANYVPLAPADVASLLAPADVASQLPLVASQLPLVIASAAAAPPLALGPLVTKALGGGLSGASAGVVQVLSLMWLRTAMNYEYSNGGNSTVATVRSLYAEGGVPRLYRGVQYALACASVAAAGWRILIAPVDTYKTALQVEGSVDGLGARVAANGPAVLWRGCLAAAAATFVGNYPWFLTYNYLDGVLPAADPGLEKLARRAALGVAASCASDVCSNGLRVVKTKVQTSPDADASPLDVARVLDETAPGLLGRGLKTRLLVTAPGRRLLRRLASEQVLFAPP
ncbi:mitochondrial carrier protein [Aureococcus anophagefferens]|nr:mitochondrial carrier protein [Aureococcus anophagefferens]